MDYYLAVDIGASSGRHMLAWLEDGKIQIKEIYRFNNQLHTSGQSLCWDLDTLFHEILNGLKKCKELGCIPKSMGIDTWGVDYVLLDKHDQVLGKTYGYRDKRTQGMDQVVEQKISVDELYNRTGIQKQPFNTIYQLVAANCQEPELIKEAETLLMIPDYFNFLLTGVKAVEYTNATTTQLVHAVSKDWDFELIERLGIKKEIFTKILPPMTMLGKVTDRIKDEIGFSVNVVLPATHDTGSAVAAIPTNGECVYISSGTWSLMGTELLHPDVEKESMDYNFTNEGGLFYRYRYLKNVMGLWMIQSVKKEIANDLSFGELCEAASKETIDSIIDVNDLSFLAPDSMTEAVKEYCRKHHLMVPETASQLACVIYNSLAKEYARILDQIEERTKKHYDCIHIVGGGSNAEYLNQLTAKYAKRTVCAGPGEATAIGNIAALMMQDNKFTSLSEVRQCIYDSFEIKTYQ